MHSPPSTRKRAAFLPDGLQRTLPGLVLILIIGVASWLLADVLPALGGVTIAILLGVIVGNLLPSMDRYSAGTKVSEKRFLPAAIALLGVELQLATLIELGGLAVLIILATITTSLLVSLQLGRMLGYSREFSLLMGAGNGICGSSAVAATRLAIDANEEDTGISISVVNLLGTLGIFFIPALAGFLQLAEADSGLLIGGSLQAVGQVVAAGFSVGAGVGSIALVVKMGRVLMLGPMVILLANLTRRKEGGTRRPGARIPRFIIGFFALSLLASFAILPEPIIEIVRTSGKFLLILAMAGIGLRIQFRTLYRSGLGALLFGMVISSTQVMVLLLILWLL